MKLFQATTLAALFALAIAADKGKKKDKYEWTISQLQAGCETPHKGDSLCHYSFYVEGPYVPQDNTTHEATYKPAFRAQCSGQNLPEDYHEYKDCTLLNIEPPTNPKRDPEEKPKPQGEQGYGFGKATSVKAFLMLSRNGGINELSIDTMLDDGTGVITEWYFQGAKQYSYWTNTQYFKVEPWVIQTVANN